jgi:hypothetical protein
MSAGIALGSERGIAGPWRFGEGRLHLSEAFDSRTPANLDGPWLSPCRLEDRSLISANGWTLDNAPLSPNPLDTSRRNHQHVIEMNSSFDRLICLIQGLSIAFHMFISVRLFVKEQSLLEIVACPVLIPTNVGGCFAAKLTGPRFDETSR